MVWIRGYYRRKRAWLYTPNLTIDLFDLAQLDDHVASVLLLFKFAPFVILSVWYFFSLSLFGFHVIKEVRYALDDLHALSVHVRLVAKRRQTRRRRWHDLHPSSRKCLLFFDWHVVFSLIDYYYDAHVCLHHHRHSHSHNFLFRLTGVVISSLTQTAAHCCH